MGRSYFIGNSEQEAVKLDLYYTDTFIQPALLIEQVRMATLEEIIAMKMDIVQRGARKKDFWDLHELLEQYSLQRMIDLHSERYPYTHDEIVIRSNLTLFTGADDDFDPDCLRGKFWEMIKLDMIETIGKYS